MGGAAGFGGPCCLTDSAEDEPLCLTPRDLLLQGLPLELGWGMAEEEEEVGMEVLLVEETGPEDWVCSIILGVAVLSPSNGSAGAVGGRERGRHRGDTN